MTPISVQSHFIESLFRCAIILALTEIVVRAQGIREIHWCDAEDFATRVAELEQFALGN
jgi:hypothetical protein